MQADLRRDVDVLDGADRAAEPVEHVLDRRVRGEVTDRAEQRADDSPTDDETDDPADRHPAGEAGDETLLALDESLGRLARQSARLARVVECRFFAGYDERETARALGLSERTVRRDWTLARAWLYRELSGA